VLLGYSHAATGAYEGARKSKQRAVTRGHGLDDATRSPERQAGYGALVSRLRLLPLVLAVALAGCGDTEQDSDSAQIGDVTQDFYAQLRDSDWDLACDDLSSVAQRNLAAWGAAHDVDGGCAGVVQEGVSALGDPSRADLDRLHVEDVQVDGDRATATVSANDTDAQLSYVREDGRWLIGPDSFPAVQAPTPAAGAEARHALLVADSGFSRVGGGKTSWGVEVRNPGADDAVGVEVEVRFAGGGTDKRTIALIPAGRTAWIGGEVRTRHDPRRLQARTRVKAWADAGLAAMPPVASGTVKNTPINVAAEALVHNTLDVPLDTLTTMYAVLLDRDGRIVGGIRGFPTSEIGPGAAGRIRLVGRGPVRGAVSAQVSADTPIAYRTDLVQKAGGQP